MVPDIATSKRRNVEFILLYIISSLSLRTNYCITYLSMTFSTKTNSTALNYLSIITNKTVEIIAMKTFSFVEVATLSHRHEETGGFF